MFLFSKFKNASENSNVGKDFVLCNSVLEKKSSFSLKTNDVLCLFNPASI